MNNEGHERRRVTGAIKLALSRIAEKDPELARLLSRTIKTGRYLSYSPASQPILGCNSDRAKKTPPRQGRNSGPPRTR
jgi:hypothetical protein